MSKKGKSEIWNIGRGKYILYTEDKSIADLVKKIKGCKLVGTYSKMVNRRNLVVGYNLSVPGELYNEVAVIAGLPTRSTNKRKG